MLFCFFLALLPSLFLSALTVKTKPRPTILSSFHSYKLPFYLVTFPSLLFSLPSLSSLQIYTTKPCMLLTLPACRENSLISICNTSLYSGTVRVPLAGDTIAGKEKGMVYLGYKTNFFLFLTSPVFLGENKPGILRPSVRFAKAMQ